MLDKPSKTPPQGDQASLSWQERELVAALKRLANAQSQYAALKAEAVATRKQVEQAQIDSLRETRYELEQARQKGKGRFGGHSARERVSKLEATERLVLDRLGFNSYEDFEEWRTNPEPQSDVDPALVDFARHELRDAEKAWLQIQALEMPEPEPEGDTDDSSESEDSHESDEVGFAPPAAS